VASALVAALTALVGVLVCRWLFNIPVTALVDLVLGIVIGSLVGTVASRSVVRVTGSG
jgi:uncharacterized membrane protein YfcA